MSRLAKRPEKRNDGSLLLRINLNNNHFKMTHTILLILSALFLIIGACKPATAKADLEEASDILKRSNLVGTWKMNPLLAVDPPTVITFFLAANGELKMSSDLRFAASPNIDPYGLHGHWHYARLDETRDIIIFRELKKGVEIENNADSFQVFEVSVDGDSMIWKPVKEYAEHDWLLFEKRILKRVK